MTRETKLGLVVAGSFLALVGGVVVARLRQVEMPGESAASANPALQAPVPEAPPPSPPEPEKKVSPVSSDALAHDSISSPQRSSSLRACGPFPI